MMQLLLGLVFLLFELLSCEAKERCCPGLKCYNDSKPFDDFPLPECPEQQKISMRVYTRNNQAENEGQVITRTTIPPAYQSGKPTVLMVHGWLGDKDLYWMHEAKNALLAKEDVNVIITGWGEGSIRIWYPQSASNTRTVGGEMAAVVANLVRKEDAKPAEFWCMGHSLGGHVCGHLGKHYHIGRITGLDPAGPMFETKDTAVGLFKTDADFVDAWHTNGKANIALNLGTLKPLGHVDFYPNGGGRQPGCVLDPFNIRGLPTQGLVPACSHLRVLDLLVESLKGPCRFTVRHRCTDQNNLPRSCTLCSGICQVMGKEAMDHEHGKFYLTTNDKAPFCQP